MSLGGGGGGEPPVKPKKPPKAPTRDDKSLRKIAKKQTARWGRRSSTFENLQSAADGTVGAISPVRSNIARLMAGTPTPGGV